MIETDELEKLINEKHENLSIFNASYTTATYVPRIEHLKQRIPTSLYFDFDDFSHQGTTLSYMVPTEAQFEQAMRRVDVRRDDIIVVYDKLGMLSAPRAFWLMKLFGMPNVAILNGTFSKWSQEKRPVEEGDKMGAWRHVGRRSAQEADFKYSYNEKQVRLYEDVEKIIKHNQ